MWVLYEYSVHYCKNSLNGLNIFTSGAFSMIHFLKIVFRCLSIVSCFLCSLMKPHIVHFGHSKMTSRPNLPDPRVCLCESVAERGLTFRQLQNGSDVNPHGA